jgi:hypothetical protein
MDNKSYDFMSQLTSIVQSTPPPSGVSEKRLLDLLTPIPAATKNLSTDKVQPCFHKEPRIQQLLAQQLFSKTQSSAFSKTSYAKPHYFAHIRVTQPKLPYLIQEWCEDEVTSVYAPSLLYKAQFELDPSGTLKQTPEGLVYLQISNEYIHALYPFFYSEGAQQPPYAAHIPVISEEEHASMSAPVGELGERFTFTVKACQKLSPQSAQETLWMLTVESPRLHLLRERHGLSSKLHSKDFALVIAVKPNTTHRDHQRRYYVKANPAYSFA